MNQQPIPTLTEKESLTIAQRFHIFILEFKHKFEKNSPVPHSIKQNSPYSFFYLINSDHAFMIELKLPPHVSINTFIHQPDIIYPHPLSARIILSSFYHDIDIDTYDIHDVHSHVLSIYRQIINNHVKNFTDHYDFLDQKFSYLNYIDSP